MPNISAPARVASSSSFSSTFSSPSSSTNCPSVGRYAYNCVSSPSIVNGSRSSVYPAASDAAIANDFDMCGPFVGVSAEHQNPAVRSALVSAFSMKWKAGVPRTGTFRIPIHAV